MFLTDNELKEEILFSRIIRKLNFAKLRLKQQKDFDNIIINDIMSPISTYVDYARLYTGILKRDCNYHSGGNNFDKQIEFFNNYFVGKYE